MRFARKLGAEYLRAFIDSQLVFGQIVGEYEARDPIMSCYLSIFQSQISFFTHFSVSYISRGKNARADALSCLATSADGTLGGTYVEHLEAPSIDAAEEALPVNEEPTWIDAYVRYLEDDPLPMDPVEAKLLRWRVSKFLVLDEQLYWRSFSYPLLRCVGPTDVNYILREIYEGICRKYLRERALASKARRQGYYWLTMKHDAAELV